MKTNNLVSVIIPVYNAEKYIKATIESVKSQTHKHWEAIIIDDKSTDNSVNMAKKYLNKKIKLIQNKKNIGAALSRNKGIKAAKGRYIAFLDSDDIWDSDKLKKQLEDINEKEVAFSFTDYIYADENAIPNGKIVHVPEVMSYKQALKNTTIFTSTVMFDTKYISKEQIYMPNVPSEDTATWWKILKTGINAFGLSKPLTVYRRPTNSLSSNKLTSIKRTWNLYRKQEGLSFFSSSYYFFFYCFNATKRRV